MFSYVVREPFDWKGTLLRRGDALTGEDARALEDASDEEARERLRRCVRVPQDQLDEPAPPASDPAPAPGPASAPRVIAAPPAPPGTDAGAKE